MLYARKKSEVLIRLGVFCLTGNSWLHQGVFQCVDLLVDLGFGIVGGLVMVVGILQTCQSLRVNIVFGSLFAGAEILDAGHVPANLVAPVGFYMA